MRLTGRVAIVTGGSSGLGAVYARSLAREGALVTVAGLNALGCEETARVISDEGGVCFPHPADLTDPAQVDGLFAGVLGRHDRIEILVNNAGGDPPGSTGKLEEVDLAHWQKCLDVNLKTAFLCCRASAGPMKRQRYGKIVNVSSRAARATGWYGAVSPEYSCAKAGVIALTRHVARELGPYGVNVNTMVPSFAISNARMQQAWDAMTEEERRFQVESTLLRRLPRPEELASVVLFLVSDDSSFMTGAILDVNGGSFMP